MHNNGGAQHPAPLHRQLPYPNGLSRTSTSVPGSNRVAQVKPGKSSTSYLPMIS